MSAGRGFGAGWSSHGITSAAVCPWARAGPVTCNTVSPANAAVPPFNTFRLEISCLSISVLPFRGVLTPALSMYGLFYRGSGEINMIAPHRLKSPRTISNESKKF